MDYNGWGNSATEQFALVLWNDGESYDLIRHHIRNDSLKIRSYVLDLVSRESWWEGKVDTATIYIQMAEEMLESGEITEQQYLDVVQLVTREKSTHSRYFLHKRSPKQPTTTQESITQTPEKEQKEMKMTFETRHYVNGTDVSSMSVEDKIQVLADAEEKLERLTDITIDSKMVKAEIKKVQQFIKDCTVQFDADC